MTVASVTATTSSARDLLALCKPRITSMVVATGIAGALAAPDKPTMAALPGLLGTALIVAGANALNMWIERESDGRMERTRERPLAAGRISPSVGLGFGLALSLLAVPLLSLSNFKVALLGVGAWFVYVAIYTPLKRFSAWALPVGAVAGAMPPLMGWTAATGGLDAGGLYLFAVLFFWQLPHFMAIALFRADEYAAAGLVVARSTKTMLIVSGLAFVVVTLLAPLGGRIATAIAALMGGAFLFLCARAARSGASRNQARDVFAFTMAHLAVVLVAMGLR